MSLTLLRYRGREINPDDTAFIQRLIAEHPGWSRRRLSAELCRAWNWVQANGALRDMVCRSLLLQLHRAGLIELPAKRFSPRNNVVARPPPAPCLPLWERPRECRLGELGPLEIRHRAANWIGLGLTSGRGHNARTTRRDQPRKELWVYPLAQDFRRQLGCGHG